jgi:hypothetical protein
MFEIRDAVRHESDGKKRDPLRPVSGVEPICHAARDELSWSHFRTGEDEHGGRASEA